MRCSGPGVGVSFPPITLSVAFVLSGSSLGFVWFQSFSYNVALALAALSFIYNSVAPPLQGLEFFCALGALVLL